MKLNDAVWGLLVMLLGIALLFAIRNFPPIPGQRYGPALFPGLTAVGLLVCGGVLAYKGIAAHARLGRRVGGVVWDDWTRSPRHVVALALVVGVNVLYIALVDRLGFIISSVLYLAATFAVFRVRARWIVPLAIGVTLIIHYVFYKLLRVPLPWGLPRGVAW